MQLELLDFCMQLILMISIIHRDFFIHQTYTFVIILMYAVALFWKNRSSPVSENEHVVSQNAATGMDRAKGDVKNEGATVNLCCIWGDYFLEHAGYIALIVWDFLFLMEEGVSLCFACLAVLNITAKANPSNIFLCGWTFSG